MLKMNTEGSYPQIDDSTYISPTAVIIGRVKIGKSVFVGPLTVIRADEPESSIIIHDNCNIQDRVIIHALENTSVLIEENTSLTHGCIIHGPCKISKYCFIGFGSVVFNSEIGEGVFIKHLAVIEGVHIFPERVVDSLTLISNEDEAKGLKCVDKNLKNFAMNVLETNLDLVERYKKNTPCLWADCI